MMVTQLTFFISGSGLEPLPNSEERCRVPYELSIDGFSLKLASLELKPEAPELKTGPQALVMHADAPLKEGVGQQDRHGKETNSMGDGDAIPVKDTLP